MVSKIKFVKPRPDKKELVNIARCFTQKYPCVKVVLNDKVISTGYDSLLRMLVARIQNVMSDRKPTKKKTFSNIYCTINHQPSLTDEYFNIFAKNIE